MSEEINKIIRLSFQSNNVNKIKSLEARLIGPSKNGRPPIYTRIDDVNSENVDVSDNNSFKNSSCKEGNK